MQAEHAETLILNRQTLQSLLTMSDVNQAIEDAFLAYGNGMALEDAAVVYLSYHMARERGLGQVIGLQ